MDSFQFVAGLFVRRGVRDMLTNEVFYGKDIKWIEYKNLLDSVFHIRGAAGDVAAVHERLKAYEQALNAV